MKMNLCFKAMLGLSDVFFNQYLDRESEAEIRKVANLDDRHGFVALMKSQFGPREETEWEHAILETDEARYCPPEIFDWVCKYCAVDCTKALLEGDTPLFIDLNVPFKIGVYPLHFAANGFSYEMIDLLLRHGARTNVRTIGGVYRADLLPLNITLEIFSYHLHLADWTPTQSIFKLIVILSLPQMKVPLEINRLLAWNTKEVNNVFDHYFMEGNLIPLTVLLMVAREKIMAPPSVLQSKDSSGLDGGMMIRQRIREEIAILIDEEVKLMCIGKNCNWRLQNKMAAMRSLLLLLDVFDRAGDAIEAHRQSVRSHMSKEKVAKDIKALLQEAGFVLKDKDVDLRDIDCESEDIKLATEVLEKTTSFSSQLQDLRMPLHSLSGSFREAQNPITIKGNRQRWAIEKFLPYYGLPVLSLEQPYRPSQLVKCDILSESPTYQLPITKKMGSAMRMAAAFFLAAKDFATCALAIKRGLTHI